MSDLRLDGSAIYSITCTDCNAKPTRCTASPEGATRIFRSIGWTAEREVFEGWHVVRTSDGCNSIVFGAMEDLRQLCPTCGVKAGRKSRYHKNVAGNIR